MSSTAADPPPFIDFPDPRPSASKPKADAGLSIDAILQRTHPSKRPANSLIDLGVQECFDSLEAEEGALRERERETARLRADTLERERVVRETELLLGARERLLDDREKVLAARLANPADQNVAALDKSLKDTRDALFRANESVNEKERIIAALRAEMEELRAARPASAESASADAPTTYADITHKSLAEQVAFLKEREAFIEQSENTLFDKAQTLQEWETRLQQSEHDQANASQDCGVDNDHDASRTIPFRASAG
jgi:hypothetical protein